MKLDLFIVTYAKDYPYMRWCLKSIAKFARGFNSLHILVPIGDAATLKQIADLKDVEAIMPVHIHEGEEWPGKGFLWHMFNIMYADNWCIGADFVAHIDPDCIFTSEVTPSDYICDGKPYLRYERYDSLGKRHPGAAAWREPTQRSLPFPVWAECMRCHPGVFHMGLYPKTRELVEQATRMPFEDYVKQQKNSFPQTLSEFNTLGHVALECFPGQYIPVEQKTDRVTPDNKLQQFWSHGLIDHPQRIWVQGGEQDVVPIEMMRRILGP